MATSNSTFPGPLDPKLDPENPYNFIPTMGVCAAFVALYSISTLLHLGQAIFYRTWFMIATAVFAGILEILGWSGRLWSSQNVDLNTPFMIQIIGCILGPTPLLAVDFVIFGAIIQHLGIGYSRMGPKWYTIVFCTCDAISLIVQAIGGAKASQASHNHDRIGARKGGDIMLGGIAFQLGVIVLFSFFVAEYLVRYFFKRPIDNKSEITRGPLRMNIKLMIAALVLNVTCLFIRGVYRTIELKDGWNGRIISTQLYFNVLDGAMVTLAIFTFNIFHPGMLLWPNGTNGQPEHKEKALASLDLRQSTSG